MAVLGAVLCSSASPLAPLFPRSSAALRGLVLVLFVLWSLASIFFSSLYPLRHPRIFPTMRVSLLLVCALLGALAAVSASPMTRMMAHTNAHHNGQSTGRTRRKKVDCVCAAVATCDAIRVRMCAS